MSNKKAGQSPRTPTPANGELKSAAEGDGSEDGPQDHWLFLVDPLWEPPEDDRGAPAATETDETYAAAVAIEGEEDGEVQMPPQEAVVGGWLVDGDGNTGRFHPNPDYVPSSPESPTDPVDAALLRVADGESPVDELLEVLAGGRYGVAVNEQDQPLRLSSPDDVMSLLVTTAPARRFGVAEVEHWRDVTASELAELVGEYQVDLLVNPAGPATIRLLGEVFVAQVTETPAERPEIVEDL
ncbi:hypothetical protein CFN78_16415 [Amycolatopsis antarctica]|uniref:Type VII secretion system-associated protein n=1 Tax=Amycolatopsis antarctica TaxID=1854586 RepID=A0A263D114_9PSEU|nr:type VII secretion system-associated protein [Amycolatopsis antarctica]OZM72122.1 hypothetical protein CFN78_16415 [Amycolatopsis antarctica]